MKLFDFTFGNDIPKTCGLFYKGGAVYDKNGKRLIVAKGGEADFGTYFNLFPYCVYRTYCGVNSVTLELCGSGVFTAGICLRDKTGAVCVLKTQTVKDVCNIKVETGSLPDGGYLYLTVRAEDGCELYSAAWSCEKEPAKVKIGIAICTFKREKFVKENLERLTEGIKKEPEWAERLHVFVVDNAKTLDLEKSPYYTLIPNRNLGGSGGFTRGMCAIEDDGTFTHMLLMDDDISFDFETVKRTWRIAASLTEDHKKAAVGGAMLVLEKPCVQYEFGGLFNGLRLFGINRNLDMRESANLLKNENAQKPDYNAWWYCCMPVSFIKEHGLPMPFFIKTDDVEYGVRCFEDLVLTNGLAVWHSNFEGKYNCTLEYYIKRNEAAACAKFDRRSRLAVAAKFLYAAFSHLLIKDYNCTELILRAYDDFMQGSRFFMQADPVQLNSEITACRPQTLTAAEIEKRCGVNPESVENTKPKNSGVMRKALMFGENWLPSCAIKKETAVVETGTPYPSHAFRRRTVVRYNAESATGYICEYDAKKRRVLRRKSMKIFFKLLFGYGKIKKDYRLNSDKICSRGHWNKLFDRQ